MKKILLTLPAVIAVLLLSCSCHGGSGACVNDTDTVPAARSEHDFLPDSLIHQFLQDSIYFILAEPEYVVVKHVMHKAYTDSIKKDTSYYTVEDSIGLLNRKQTGFLQCLLFSDSTWNWSKIMTKHAFEPEIVCQFIKGKSSVSVLISPASLEFGFGYTNVLLRKEYLSDRTIEQFIQKLGRMKRKEIQKDVK